jgi:hypothetical protein
MMSDGESHSANLFGPGRSLGAGKGWVIRSQSCEDHREIPAALALLQRPESVETACLTRPVGSPCFFATVVLTVAGLAVPPGSLV